MKPGRVIGTVTLHSGHPAFRGGRWLLVAPLGPEELQSPDAGTVAAGWTPVVYDRLGAGPGDLILYVEGSEATQPFDEPIPLDALCVALLDRVTFQPPSATPATAL
jgi:microcompartment protein CcmK/EutM